MNPTIQRAVENALVAQPWWVRRKDTLTAVAGTLLQLLNVATAYATDAPEWVNITIAVLIGLCQVIVHAGTPGAITPSMAARLEAQAPAPATPGDGLAAGAEAHELAGYSTPNPYDQDYQDYQDYQPAPSAHETGSTLYEGVHRAD